MLNSIGARADLVNALDGHSPAGKEAHVCKTDSHPD